MIIRNRVVRFAAVLVLCVVTLVTQTGAIRNIESGYTLQALDSIKANPQPTDNQVLASSVAFTRGVVLQSKARIVDGQLDLLAGNSLNLKWTRSSGGGDYTSGIECKGTTTIVNFPEVELIRIAHWVASSDSTIAFTYLPMEGFPRERSALIGKGFEPVEQRAGRPAWLSTDGCLVPPSLQAGKLVDALAYIDFSDERVSPPAFSYLLSTPINEKAILNGLNGGRRFNKWGTSKDQCYVNSDLHSNFTLELPMGKLSGVPWRYYWKMGVLDTSPEVIGVRTFNQELHVDSPALRQMHADAMAVCQIVAILRAFRDHKPEQLLDFVNQGLARH